jgi:tetratricopeptide (TPR) repeat protein
LPDGIEAGVEKHVGEIRGRLDALRRDDESSPRELAEAYGELAMVLHAHQLHELALPGYRNAQRLEPDDVRWPFYLAYLHHHTGSPDLAIELYWRVLEIAPSHRTAAAFLAQAYLAAGQPERAEPLFEEALQSPRARAAALAGLGQIAVDGGDYTGALERLEEALALDPQADRIHYLLGMAHRGLGQMEQAQAHLRQRGEIAPQIVEPLVVVLGEMIASARVHVARGITAIEARRFDVAVREFRLAVETDPTDVESRLNLGFALSQMGDLQQAEQHWARAVELAPDNARANFNLANRYERTGRRDEAIAHYRAAAKAEPKNLAAHFFLANLLLHRSEYAEAAEHYGRVVALDAKNELARLLEIAALVRLGDREAEVGRLLEAAVLAHPDRIEFRQALARLLAAAPIDAQRDGKRAVALAEQLWSQSPGPESARTLAMALAEAGDFEAAVRHQREAAAMAAAQGNMPLVTQLEVDLKRYQADEPCRVPWAAGDPMRSILPPVGGAAPVQGRW